MKNLEEDIYSWWENRRIKYNFGLLKGGSIAFICYLLIGIILIMPRDDDFEISIFTMIFQSIGYVAFMGFANILYFSGFIIDERFNTDNNLNFRKRLYKKGYWFSFGLPFIAPFGLSLQVIDIYLFH